MPRVKYNEKEIDKDIEETKLSEYKLVNLGQTMYGYENSQGTINANLNFQ